MTEPVYKFETTVHHYSRPSTHPGGVRVNLYAPSLAVAKARAVEIGWTGDPDDASVAVHSITEDKPPRPAPKPKTPEPPTHGFAHPRET